MHLPSRARVRAFRRQVQRFSSILAPSGVLFRTLPRVAIVLVLVAAVFQYFQYGIYDPHKCRSLLTDGRWYGDKTQPSTPAWRPSDCVTNSYEGPVMAACLSGRHLVLVGDSTIRQLYWAALRRLDRTVAKTSLQEFALLDNRQVDLSKVIKDVQVDFVWDPWLNSTSMFGQLARFRHRPDSPMYEAQATAENNQSPAIIVLGTPGLWAARNGKDSHLELFGEGINTVLLWLLGDISNLVRLPRRGHRLVTDHKPMAYGTPYEELSNHVFLVPVLEPLWERLSYGRRATITPTKVEMMNWNLRNSDAIDQSHILWGFEVMVSGRKNVYLDDGIHVHDYIADQRLNIVLNARCNAGLPVHDVANQATCCRPYPASSRIQRLLLSLAVMGLPWLIMDRGSPSDRKLRGIIAASSLLVVAAYCYLADRTHLFSKEQKEYRQDGFILSIAAVGVVFLLSVHRVIPETTKKQPDPLTSFLSRMQTDEWKGWMQSFVLLYGFHGVPQSSAWYYVFRLFLSIFLFLSSYGHMRHFLQVRDYSLRRLAYVLVRLNLLSIILSYTTNSSWIMYYFCPLTSFWFLLMYLMLSILSDVNDSPVALLLKIGVAAMTTTLMVHIQGVLGGVLLALERGLGVAWDLETVRFHLALDQLIPYFGMVTAIVAHRVSQGRRPIQFHPMSTMERADAWFDRMTWNIFHPEEDSIPIKAMVVLFSGVLLCVFLLIALAASGSTDAFDAYHPFTGPWFVLAAVVLRNCHSSLRGIQFTGPIAMGRLSLEVALLQYHIWLAGDTTTILRIASAPLLKSTTGPLLENSQTTLLLVVFLWACVKCRNATQQITDLITIRVREKGRGAAPQVPKGCDV